MEEVKEDRTIRERIYKVYRKCNEKLFDEIARNRKLQHKKLSVVDMNLIIERMENKVRSGLPSDVISTEYVEEIKKCALNSCEINS